MEFINRIEISSVVGTVRKQSVADSIVANFSVVTETSYNDRNGCAVVETTWHNVVTWQNSNMPDLETIERGSHVNVQGRLRTRRNNQRFSLLLYRDFLCKEKLANNQQINF